MIVTSSQAASDQSNKETDNLPPLLKHIMSTGSMVEDIERQHISGDGTGDDGKSGPTLTHGIPDLTQPPPNHPAYRGPSPQTNLRQARKSPMDMYSGSGRPKSASYCESLLQSEKGPVGSGTMGQVSAPQILSGNLLPVFSSSSSSSQHSDAQPRKLSPESTLLSRRSPKGATDTGAQSTVEPSTVLTTPLLTPADLLQPSSSFSSSQSSVTSFTTATTTTTFSTEKVCNRA